MATVATFLFPDEAKMALGLLRSAEIPCYLENENALSAVWPLSISLGWLRLVVPESMHEEAATILADTVSEPELIAYLGADAGPDISDEVMSRSRPAGRIGARARALVLGLIFSPAVDQLRIFYF